MASNMVYVPLSEETLTFIEKLKSTSEDIDTFLKKLLGERIYQEDIELMQAEKMKELWDNETDEIWNNITWKYDFKNYMRGKHVKVKVPVIPKTRGFKKQLRDKLMKDNPYASHWVDAVIRTAYSILESSCSISHKVYYIGSKDLLIWNSNVDSIIGSNYGR